MDKQKQIEEMAQCKNFNGYTCKSCGVKYACDRYILAQELYDLGYRKIPKYGVVLDKDFCEQREEMIVDLQYDKFELMNELSEKDNKIALLEETIECIKFNVDFTRKDTAEKFADFAKSKVDEYKKMSLQHREKGSKDRECYYLGKEKSMEEILEICKEITEGKDG